MKSKKNKKIILTLLLAIILLGTNIALASYTKRDDDSDDIYIDKINENIVKKPTELDESKDIDEQLENPKYPNIYTYRWDYKIGVKENGLDKDKIIFQPYIASVGENASPEERAEVLKEINLPEVKGYKKPNGIDSYDVTYDFVKNNAKDTKKASFLFYGNHDYKYEPEEKYIKVKYIFQNLYDHEKYENPNGEKEPLIKEYKAKTGDKFKIPGLNKEDSEKYAKGFEPEQNNLEVTVPENASETPLIYHYNRKTFQLDFDTDGGSYVPNMTLYYGQTIPYFDYKPTKDGSVFKGWKSNKDIETSDGTKIKKGDLIDMKNYPDGLKDAMPSENIIFTAVWEEEPTADYKIQFWTQKAESDGYDFIGAKVIKDADTGSRPNLDSMLPEGFKFPEIEKDLTKKGKEKELNKYYVRNTKKIKEENTENVKNDDGSSKVLVKKVHSDGSTTYNIYYDRQTYTMLFEKFCIDSPEEGFPAKEAKMVLPDGRKYDSTKEVNKPYKFTAKFGERLTKWPNDMWLIEKGGVDFDPNRSFIGWQLNTENNNNEDQSLYLDTPPYWLTSKDFIDRDFTSEWGPDVRPATHSTSTGEVLPERTISLGPCQSAEDQFAIYYMEYLFEGFDGKLHYNPDMSYTKIDTNAQYEYPSPGIVGFKPKYEGIDPYDDVLQRPAKKKGYTERLTEYTFDELKEKLAEYEKDRSTDEKSFFDPIGEKGINGVPFKDIERYRFAFTYEREKYTLYLDKDPSDVNAHADFSGEKFSNGKDAIISDVYYDLPLRKLNLDEDYKLTEDDKPKNLPDNYVFKGWALDAQGSKLIKDTIKESEKLESQIAEKYKELEKNSNDKEKKFKLQNEIKELKSKLDDADANMPNYDVVLYAKWGEPDKNYKVKFDPNLDPNDGEINSIEQKDIATHKDGERIKISTEFGKVPYKSPEKLKNEGNTQVFDVANRMTIKEPPKPQRDGYDFLGWELVTYNENGSEDTSYKDKYGVPRLYSFGNEIISDLHLRAIWVKNGLVDVKVYHHLLDKDFNEVKLVDGVIKNQRVKTNTTAYGVMQGEDYILANDDEFDNKNVNEDTKNQYEKYKEETERENSYYQNQVVQAEDDNTTYDDDGNPQQPIKLDFKNQFHFYYRPYRYRKYTVNYLLAKDGQDSFETVGSQKDFENVIEPEEVLNGNRHFDSVNYRKIRGFKLVSPPQTQLFFDINEYTHELNGINGIKNTKDVNFYYKDVRVLKTKNPNTPIPKGYHRITFKALDNGSFGTDKDGKEIKEIYYDVIDGLNFKNIPVPTDEEKNGIKITPDKNYNIGSWSGRREGGKELGGLLDENTSIKHNYEFEIDFIEDKYPEVKPIKVFESSKDDGGNFINDFMPTNAQIEESISDLIKLEKYKDYQVLEKEKIYDKVKEDEAYNNKPSDVKPKKDSIKVRVNFKNDTYKDFEIPVEIYKNIYRALDSKSKPNIVQDDEFLKDFVKVDVVPTNKAKDKQTKTYYVNPKAQVRIPENDPEGENDWTFEKWTADLDSLEDKDDFKMPNRHIFENETVLTARYSKTPKDIVYPPSAKMITTYVGNYPTLEEYEQKIKAGKIGKTGEVAEIDSYYLIDKKPDVSKEILHPEKEIDDPTDPTKKVYTNYQRVKVTYKTGEVFLVDVPVRVLDTIKEVPDENTIPGEDYKDYILVTVDPTDKAKDPTKKYYRVRKDVEVTIPSNNPEGIEVTSKNGESHSYEFTKWKEKDTKPREWEKDKKIIGKFEKDTEIIAKYSLKAWQQEKPEKNVIPNDPDNPQKKPKGYVSVKFTSDDGLTLSGIQEYFVKKNLEITLKDIKWAQIEEKVGYKFDKWDKEKDLEIKDQDIVVNATSIPLKDVIPKKDGEEQPKGYVKVDFKTDGNGTLEGETSYYVNPTKEVTLEVPETKANIGYKFKEWDKDANKPTKYEKDTTITAKFKALDDVSETPIKDYVKVTFQIEGKGGKIKEGEVETYYVNPEKKVIVTTPKLETEIGYKFKGWDKDTSKLTQYTEKETIIKGTFEKIADIIPEIDEDGKPNDKPKGYVEVIFEKGKHGVLEGITKYYVNPKAGKKLKEIKHPEIKANNGYEKYGWDTDDNTEITKKIIVTARYSKEFTPLAQEPSAKMITTYVGNYPTLEEYEQKIKAGKIGNSGKVAEIDSYYLIDKKPDVSKEILDPEKEIDDPTDPTKKVYTNYQRVKVTYKTGEVFLVDVPVKVLDTIKEVPDENTIPGEDYKDYILVTVNPTDKAVNKEKSYYRVRRDVEVTIPEKDPTGIEVKSEKDSHSYEFSEWREKEDTEPRKWEKGKKITGKFEKDTEIIAKYSLKAWQIEETKKNIIPDPEEIPEGYVSVTFTNDNGLYLDGTQNYAVKKNVNVKLSDLKWPNIGEHLGYEFVSWDQEKTLEIKDKDIVVRASSKAIDDVIPNDGNHEKPKDYVKVDFTTDGHGSLSGQLSYFVNPTKEVTLEFPQASPNTGYEFGSWDPDNTSKPTVYNVDTTITAYFNELNDVSTEPVEGYVEVSFVTQGEGGSIMDGQITKFYVNPEKEVILPPPSLNVEIGYAFNGWDFDTIQFVQYKENKIVTGTFAKLPDVIPEVDGNGNINDKPHGYVEVIFEKGDHGDLEGITKYYVNPKAGKTLAEIAHPKIVAKTDYKVKGWDTDDKTVINNNIIVTALYEKIEKADPKPQEPTNPPQPSNPSSTEPSVEKPSSSNEKDKEKDVKLQKVSGDDKKGSNVGGTKMPKTGIESNLGFYLSTIGLSTIGLFILKKKNK
ncbi:InlB B-repeat-containing protein [Anaerococcus vaginalis]|uniref:InlB B-repeat-containing protein n=1 Tax=Anaerococcus vaginalis TaxID=33037 RepID=A0A7T4F1Q8_9FIRM|nr:InlB B-repeat-containing protein [Anaerococcus vaginalis]QQB62239.1 InlB B-repeat-containing protein [Anaerococcus vaginalis]